MRKVQECYSEYAEVFHRCSLPARTSISFDKEQEMLNYVDKSAKNIIKVLGISLRPIYTLFVYLVYIIINAIIVSIVRLICGIKHCVEKKSSVS